MSCAVPSCAGLDQRLVPFPQNSTLQLRWKQAIETGTGLKLSPRYNQKVCSWHFGNQTESSGYWEPFQFLHRNGKTIQVGSCRFCLRYSDTTKLVPKHKVVNSSELSDAIEQILKIPFATTDILSEICEECKLKIETLGKWIEQGKQTESEYRALEKATKNSMFNASNHSNNCTLKIEIEPIEDDASEQETVNDIDYSVEQPCYSYEITENVQLNPRLPIATVYVPENTPAKHGRIPQLMKTREKPNLREYFGRKCYICNELLDSSEEMIAHLTEMHSYNEHYKCSECEKSFKLVTSFNRHLSFHDSTNRPLKCTHCTVGFKTKYALQLHENRAHDANHEIAKKKIPTGRDFQCVECGQTFRTNYDLVDHDRFQHQKLPGVTCKLCGKHFRNRASLRKHHLVHVGNKPYNCQQCDSAFKNTTSLINHVARLHGPADWSASKGSTSSDVDGNT